MKLFLDIETYYNTTDKYDLRKLSILEYCRDPRFKFLGLGFAAENSFVGWVGPNEIAKWVKSLVWSEIDVIAFNAKFDLFALKTYFDISPRSYIDPLAMSRAVLGKTIKSHSLASLAEYFKFESKGHLDTNGKSVLTPEEERALIDYCKHDVDLCRQIFNKLSPFFPESQYVPMDQTIRMFVEPKLTLNVPLLQEASIVEAKRREDIFKDIGIDKSEFASNVKFPKLLEKEGFEVPMKDSPRKTDDKGNALKIPALALGDIEFLEMLEGENERLKELCEARVAAKSTLLETRSAKMAAIGATGLWSFDVEFSGADQTHRFSGGSGAGGNPQNFTRGSALRAAVEAPEGFELVVGDFSNIEMRLVAYLSRDPGLIEAIETGRDIYCDFASVFYGRTITKDDVKERRFGKTAILGLGYGCGWKKFQKMVRIQTGESISDEDAKKAVELYRTRYARVPALWKKCDAWISILAGTEKPEILPWNFPVRFVREEILLPSGLAIRFPNLRQEQGEDYLEWVYDIYRKGHLEHSKLYGGKVVENICQGLAGELCKQAMQEMGNMVMGQVHDELIVVCKKGLGSVTAAKLKRAMSVSPSWMPEMRLDAEVHCGKNWGIK